MAPPITELRKLSGECSGVVSREVSTSCNEIPRVGNDAIAQKPEMICLNAQLNPQTIVTFNRKFPARAFFRDLAVRCVAEAPYRHLLLTVVPFYYSYSLPDQGRGRNSVWNGEMLQPSPLWYRHLVRTGRRGPRTASSNPTDTPRGMSCVAALSCARQLSRLGRATKQADGSETIHSGCRARGRA